MIVHMTAHVSENRRWVSITAHGVREGRFGCLASAAMPLAEELEKMDPEELIAVVIAGVHQLVYHS